MDKQIAAHRSLASLDGWNEPSDSVVRDDVLALVFMCCDPVLAIEARVALALRTLCGLSTAAVARLFLVPEATMAQRLVRAKRRLAQSGAPLTSPAAHELSERLPAVLATVHLLFTEGHNATSGARARPRRVLRRSGAPGPSARRLDARRAGGDRVARVCSCSPTPAERRESTGRVNRSPLRAGPVAVGSRPDRRRRADSSSGPCASAAPGVTSSRRRSPPATRSLPRCADTDWKEVADLYALLENLAPDPVVRLNRAVAVAEAWGPEAGLDVLDGVVGLDDFHLRWSVDAELRRRCGRPAAAAGAYRAALACRPNDAERRFLEARLARSAPTTGRREHMA